jgi:Deoxycytidine deaminase
MVLPGHLAINNVKGATAKPQPAGVDISVCEVYEFKSRGFIGVERRELPCVERLEDVEGFWALSPGVYKVRYCEVVEIPLEAVALCFPRSSLLRMGVDLRCTVWDPGYRGRGEGLLVVHNPYGVRLEKGVGVAQLVFVRLLEKPRQGYSGLYQGEGLEGDRSSSTATS